MMVPRYAVVQFARGLIGTPFKHQHRAPGIGIDCAGVFIVTARALGLVAPTFDVTSYSATPDGHSLRAYCEEHMQPIEREDMGFGDGVLVAWNDGPPQHLGILADYLHGGFSLIHAEGRRHKAVIETRLLFGRSMRFVAAYSFSGVA